MRSYNAKRCSPLLTERVVACSGYDGVEVCKYLVHGDDLAVCLLDLPQLREEVPEAGLGDNIVGRKNPHAVKLGGRVGLAGEETSNDLVLLKATCA